jgi:UPF0755 protein
MAWHHTHLPTFHLIAAWYKRRDIFEKIGINLVAWGGLLWFVYAMFIAAPIGFASGAYVTVEEGAPLKFIARDFERQGIISNARLFEWVTRALGDERHIPAGVYYFSRQDNLVWVAIRMLVGDYETAAIRIAIPEGSTVNDIAKILQQKVPYFNKQEFIARAREGYMFPDTYFFRPGQSTEAILSVFENNFRVRLLKVQDDIYASGRSLDEVLTMASILEKEASKSKDRQMISGVLWHRIHIGMPLQVDAVFPYIIGKNTFELTREDLQLDSPYNTYKYKGLPPGPINNPGLDTILAAAKPEKNSYVYFLSDKQGTFHYSATYEGHLTNKHRYLD